MMAGTNWLADKRSAAAVDHILDAAAELFGQRPAASVGMNEIASVAGCSRATLYRYFENRDALYTAFVNRQALGLGRRMAAVLHGIDDPARRLTTGVLTALRLVRESPELQSWFLASDAPVGAEVADQSDVITAMVAVFVRSLGGDDAQAVTERKARWLVRMMTSLLLLPGRDDADERAMIEDFVMPVLVPANTTC
jgi:AcrR family transcriptional regulator